MRTDIRASLLSTPSITLYATAIIIPHFVELMVILAVGLVHRTGHKWFHFFNWFWPVQRTLARAVGSASGFSGATGQTPATHRRSNRTRPNRSCRLAAIGRGYSPGAPVLEVLYSHRLRARQK